MHFQSRLCVSAAVITAGMILGIAVLHLIAKYEQRLGGLSRAICRAPCLDWIITYFTVLPLIVGSIFFGFAGLLGALIGQVFTIVMWGRYHEWRHPEAARGPRIVKFINRLIGPWRNHAALWLTMTVSPVFWLIRMAEIILYPLLRRLVGFPKYNEAEWVAVSRQKFAGLVGHDLIWCLYCDWMTGVWSLGTEILRNVESFWCPIRFSSTAKCRNCTIDFPDIDGGWVEASGTMQEVYDAMEEKHSHGFHGWFGHAVRVTVKGEAIAN
jgi:hypothetical protein